MWLRRNLITIGPSAVVGSINPVWAGWWATRTMVRPGTWEARSVYMPGLLSISRPASGGASEKRRRWIGCAMRVYGDLFVRGRGMRCLIDDFENLLHNFRVQDLPTVERHCHPEPAFAEDPATPLDRRCSNPAQRRARSAAEAVHRGSLGIDLNGGR